MKDQIIAGYKSTGKCKESKFRHATLGLVDFGTMTVGLAEKLVQAGYLTKVKSSAKSEEAENIHK